MFGLEREKKFDTTLAVWWFIWLGFKLVLGKPLRLSSLFTASRGESNLKKEKKAGGGRGERIERSGRVWRQRCGADH